MTGRTKKNKVFRVIPNRDIGQQVFYGNDMMNLHFPFGHLANFTSIASFENYPISYEPPITAPPIGTSTSPCRIIFSDIMKAEPFTPTNLVAKIIFYSFNALKSVFKRVTTKPTFNYSMNFWSIFGRIFSPPKFCPISSHTAPRTKRLFVSPNTAIFKKAGFAICT